MGLFGGQGGQAGSAEGLPTGGVMVEQDGGVMVEGKYERVDEVFERGVVGFGRIGLVSTGRSAMGGLACDETQAVVRDLTQEVPALEIEVSPPELRDLPIGGGEVEPSVLDDAGVAASDQAVRPAWVERVASGGLIMWPSSRQASTGSP